MTVENPGSGQSNTASERVVLRTLGERRRRVVRSVAMVVIVTLALLVPWSLNRDQQAVDACRMRLDYTVKTFQEHYDQAQRSPSELPLPPGERGMRDHYLYNWRYTESYRPEVGVCCCSTPHTRLFQAPRRHVVIFDEESRTFRLEWMKESEFVQRADELGLRVRVAP